MKKLVREKNRFFTFILFITILLSSLQSKIISQTSNASTGDYVVVNGAKLWYQIEGTGDPIILIPGGPEIPIYIYHLGLMNWQKAIK